MTGDGSRAAPHAHLPVQPPGEEVWLYQYDLTNGAARALSMQFIGRQVDVRVFPDASTDRQRLS